MKKIVALVALLSLSACINGTQVGQQPRLSTSNAPLAINGDVKVAAGDTVYGIARRHNVPMSALIAANNLKPPYVLQAGQTIHLPVVDSPMNSSATSATQPYDRGVMQGEALAPLDTSNAPITKAPLDENGNALPEDAYNTNGGKHEIVLTPLGPTTTPSPTEVTTPTSLVPQNPSVADAAAQAAPKPAAPAVPAKQGLFDWPVKGHVVNNANNGLDIAAPKGTPVQSAAAGTVVKAGPDGVTIRHPDGYETTYTHLERVLVDADAVVSKGDAIGTVGTAGTKSPLVHFELKMEGTPVDPAAWLPSK